MNNINVRISSWCNDYAPLDNILRTDKKHELISNAFCDNQEKCVLASYELYTMLWNAHPELGPCPDIFHLSELEHDRVFYSKYRDHASHVIKVFFLGLYLYENNEVIKVSVHQRLQNLGMPEDFASFLLIWTVSSLYHDCGYVFENDKIESDNALYDSVLSKLNGYLNLPLSNTGYFTSEINASQESNLIKKHRIFTHRIESISDLEDDISFSLVNEFADKSMLSLRGSPKNGIQQYYQFTKSHQLNADRRPYIDHGIASALILLKIWNAYSDYVDKLVSEKYELISENTSLFEKLTTVKSLLALARIAIIESASSISLHNIKKGWRTPETLGQEIDLDRFVIKLRGDNQLPFAFLLRLADELQCWDRRAYCAPTPSTKCLSGSEFDIYSRKSQISLYYAEDSRFKNPASEPDSKYSKLICELKRYLDFDGLTFGSSLKAMGRAEDEKNARKKSWNNSKKNTHPIASDNSNANINSYLKDIVELYGDRAKIYADMNVLEERISFDEFLLPTARPFVSRSFQVVTPLISHAFENSQNPLKLEGFNELFNYFNENHRVAITGDPGSGKSTTIEYAAYKFASIWGETKSQLIPVLIDLGGMSGESIETYLTEHLDDRVKNLLGTDSLILLLDGLNEISAKDAANLHNWINEKPNQSLIITCRRIDYIERQLPLKRVDIIPLDLSQIWAMMGKYLVEKPCDDLFWSLAGSDAHRAWNYYCERYCGSDKFESFWYGNIGTALPSEKEKSIIGILQKDLKEHNKMPGLLPLLSNPFLLYAAIWLFCNKKIAPSSRRDVLTGFAITMLEKCRISSNLLYKGWQSSIWADLDLKALSLQNDKGNWLAYCAYRMIERGGGTAVPLSWLQDELENHFQGEETRGFIDELIAANLFERLRTSTILVKFRYQVMQEFFAAVHFCVISDYSIFSTIFTNEEWWKPSVWDETIRIAAELLNNATKLIQALYTIKPDLAYSCITEGVYCRDDIYKELMNPQNSKTPTSPRARAKWGLEMQTSGKGDSRKGVGLKDGLPNFDWIYVKNGQVNVGCKNGGNAELGVAGTTVSVTIDNDFYISKYPTTRMQFEAFLLAGYEDRKNWSDLGWQWKGMRSYPELWLDPRYCLGNAPVVGVSWFEAMAFCNWISKNLDVDAWQIDLPLEAEWEYAAHNSSGALYPWGNDYLPGYANIDESADGATIGPFSLGHPTSVGIYSQGVNTLGIADLCGNVWEWCKSKWDVEYAWPETVLSETVDHRVIKGGSWYNSIRFANLGVHDCLDADLGTNDIGFRVVMRKKGGDNLAEQLVKKAVETNIVKKVLIIGARASGRTQFIRTISDFPLVEVHKKDFSSGLQVQMDYGRHFYKGNMYYFYAPLIADDANLARFNKEMNCVIYIISGCDSQLINVLEQLYSINRQCKELNIPLIIGFSGSDLGSFSIKESDIACLLAQDIIAVEFCALDRASCSKLLDVLWGRKNQSMVQ